MNIDDYKKKELKNIKYRIDVIKTNINLIQKSNTDIVTGNLKFTQEYVKKFKDNNVSRIVKLEEELSILNHQVNMIENGEFDDYFIDNTKQKLEEDKDSKSAKSVPVVYDKEKDIFSNSDDNKLRYEMKKAYYNYELAADTLPEYMVEKLKNMPHNKGYVWKNVWFFGYLPDEEETMYLTEYNHGKLYLHTCGRGFYNVKEIEKNNNKQRFHKKHEQRNEKKSERNERSAIDRKNERSVSDKRKDNTSVPRKRLLRPN